MRNHLRCVHRPASPLQNLVRSMLNQVKEIVSLPRPSLSQEVRSRLLRPYRINGQEARTLVEATQNPSVKDGQYRSSTISILNNIESYANGKSKSSGIEDTLLPRTMEETGLPSSQTTIAVLQRRCSRSNGDTIAW
jgi:hypothetical protein